MGNPGIDIGVDVSLTHLNAADVGTATFAANGARPAGTYEIQDQDVFRAFFRLQHNFMP